MRESLVKVVSAKVTLDGNLVVPDSAKGIVLFAHGSGSSRHSQRNKFVARALQDAGLATLLIDLLTLEEERVDNYTMHHRFDIKLLAERLAGATDWLVANKQLKNLDIGYFGASTGAAAALVASARWPDSVRAIVSRGGRPDLTGPLLSRVRAPTLLIVGGDDIPVIELNETALAKMIAVENKKLVIVPGATHLFEEPGKLEEVAMLAVDWFKRYLGKKPDAKLSQTE